MLEFSESVIDPKAGVFVSSRFVNKSVGVHSFVGGIITTWKKLITVLFVFYDAPTAPLGMFNPFLNIVQTATTVKTQSYSSFVSSLDPDIPGNLKNLR